MGNHHKAIQEIQRAIRYLESNEITKKSDAFVVFYYNYATELEHVGEISEALKKAKKALSLCSLKPEMKGKIEESIKVLELKM